MNSTFQLFLSIILLASLNAGCSTISSLGIPLASGNHGLMSAANSIRSEYERKPTPRELSKTVLPPHQIEPGDIVSIESTDFSSGVQLPGDQTVQADGTINLGVYGTVHVAGQTTNQVESNVESMISTISLASSGHAGANVVRTVGLASQRSPIVNSDVSVRLIGQATERFYVLGEVTAPGSYPLAGNETVLDALIAAGGVTSRANNHKLILVRPSRDGQKRIVLPVCYQSIVQLGDTSSNYQMYPGDRIYVPSLTLLEDVRQSIRPGGAKQCPHCQTRR